MRFGRNAIVVAAAIGGAAVAVAVTLAVDSNDSAPARAATTVPSKKGPSFLFVQDAHRGTLVAHGAAGEYDLTLYGVHPSTLYFLDRPGNEVGVLPIEKFLEGLLGRSNPDGPPNAAVNALVPTEGNHQYVMGVAILSDRYDKAKATLVLHVRASKQGPLLHREHGRTDVTLPRSFGHTSVFVDAVIDNVCDTFLKNYTDTVLNISQDGSTSKWPSDSWTEAPQASLNPGAGAEWTSSGGSFEGCHNEAEWVSQDESWGVDFVMTDPWSGGGDVASCTVIGENDSSEGGPYECLVDPGYQKTSSAYLGRSWAICSDSTSGAADPTQTCDQLKQQVSIMYGDTPDAYGALWVAG